MHSQVVIDGIAATLTPTPGGETNELALVDLLILVELVGWIAEAPVNAIGEADVVNMKNAVVASPALGVSQVEAIVMALPIERVLARSELRADSSPRRPGRLGKVG
jgi:hypothetical protein